jgi:peptidoglycan/xylan/chitin deacetylase (PgdA/CDA1 family)
LGAKTLLRSTLIRTAARLRVDELAFGLQRWLTSRGHPQRMLVVEMHETTAREEKLLRRQLEWITQHFTLVDLATFARLWQDCEHRRRDFNKPPLLFTFDDGRMNNHAIAAPLLESFGARGVFFVVPQWVQCGPEDARAFYYSRIDIRSVPDNHAEEDCLPMTIQQLADLARRGHSVGNHTFSHVNLAALTEAQLYHEIIESGAQIASWTGKPVDAFAWTFSWDSISPAALQLIRQYYQFCFAPCPGSIDCQLDSTNLIWRTEVEARYSASDFRFMYSGLADPLWRTRRKRLKAMLATSTSVAP